MSIYYLIRSESEPSKIGVKNGIKQADIIRDGYRNPEKFDYLIDQLGTNKYWEIKDTLGDANFEIECARLLPEAKRTEFLQFGPALMNCHFLISNKVLLFLLKYTIQNHHFFKAKVIEGIKEWDYFLFFLFPLYNSFIDFEKSTFFTGNDLLGKKFHTFNNEVEKQCFEKNNYGLKIQEFHLKNEARALDLFVIDGAHIAISERLKLDLESKQLASGIKILPAFGEVPWPKVK